ncbi:GntR family transcriptional regulator [Mesorhizobium sp. 1B3]|uniref:GntR family transcriptional regulator n=1 Tax=Mesorhizobium sp. 1B3 TaxID=3243599 RepID=UPI003D98322D
MNRQRGVRRKLALSGRMAMDPPEGTTLAEAASRAKNPTLSRAKPAPLHEQIRREMIEMISGGTWPAGSVLPNEGALAQMLGVAVGTVRRAMTDLAADGLIARRPRTGTVVTGRIPQLRLQDSFHYFRLHGPGDTLARSRSKVFGYLRRKADKREQEVLHLGPDDEVHKFERVRLVDDTPVMHDIVVFPAKLAPDIMTEADIPPTLAIHFLEKYGIRITAQREKLSAALATDNDRETLNRAGNFAVLVIDEVAYNQTGEAVLIGQHRAVTDNFKYLNEIS